MLQMHFTYYLKIKQFIVKQFQFPDITNIGIYNFRVWYISTYTYTYCKCIFNLTIFDKLCYVEKSTLHMFFIYTKTANGRNISRSFVYRPFSWKLGIRTIRHEALKKENALRRNLHVVHFIKVECVWWLKSITFYKYGSIVKITSYRKVMV